MHLITALWVPLTLAALIATARAQDSRYFPKTPESDPNAAAPALPAAPPPALSRAGAAEDREWIPALRGVVFVPDRRAVKAEGVTVDGIRAEGLPLLEAEGFRKRLEPFLGRPVTLRRLNELTREVVLYFREQDRPVVDVLVPEQSISSGTVQVIVAEGRLGRVMAEGNTAFSTPQLVRHIRLSPGGTIVGRPLLEDIGWLNQNPFRQVDLVFARGANSGETDLILRTRDRRPWRVFAGYEDSGTELTDSHRVVAGVNWGNAFGRDQLLNYQVTASPDFEKLVAHSGSYVVPLPWRHTLTFFGSYATSRPELTGGLFTLKGNSWQVSGRYRVPLKSRAKGTFTQDLSVGFDFKRSNNNLEFGGFQVFDQWTDIAQMVAGYTATQTDRLGQTTADVQLFLSPGGLTEDNGSRRFREARSQAAADYAYGRVTVERRTALPRDFKWITRATAQIASANLLSSEQLGLGGYDTVRGYDEREVNGDEGFLLSNEVQTPAVALASRLGLKNSADRLIALVFLDYGNAKSHRPASGEPSRFELLSAGVGLRYQFGSALTARLDCGWGLADRGLDPDATLSRVHLGITLAY